MTDTTNKTAETLAAELERLACGRTEWRVMNPKDGNFCIAFDHFSSSNPEREARQWLDEHRKNFPNGLFVNYEVRECVVHSPLSKAATEAAAMLRSLATQPQAEQVAADKDLWLWKNGDHYLAFTHLYPCFEPGGDPMVLGEPAARAVFKRSFDRTARPPVAQQGAAEAAPSMPEPVKRLLRYAGKSMRTARNPSITAREAIEIGNWIAAAMAAQPVAQGLTETDSELLNFIGGEYLTLEPFEMPTGAGDADVGWRTIQHHRNSKRIASEVYEDDPREAIRQAMARIARDPYCTRPLHEAALSTAHPAQYGEYPCRTCGLPKEWGNDPLSTPPETSATASEQPERIGDLLAVLLRTSERIGASKDHAEVLKLRQERRKAYHQIARQRWRGLRCSRAR